MAKEADFPLPLALRREKRDEGYMVSSSSLSPPRLRPAGVVYAPGTRETSLLSDFARELSARGWRVGGLTQRTLRGPDGGKREIVATEIDTGETLTLAQYAENRDGDAACAFDTAALAEATRAVRRAIADRADLIVIEKFSHHERDGQGLFAEILSAMAEGIPTLTLVSANSLTAWGDVTGGLSCLLPPEPEALWRWWGAERMYRDLELGVTGGTAKRVLVGLNWVVIESEAGCGLAQTPERGTAGCRSAADGSLVGTPLPDLAARVHSTDPFESAIGLAAINAFHNRFDLESETGNGLEAFAQGDEPVAVIGRFPKLEQRFSNYTVIEQTPREGEVPAWAYSWVLPGAERVLITASTLVNRSLPGLLAACPDAETALIGPSAPLTPRLHSYGIDLIGGMVVTDVDGLFGAIGEGGAISAIKPFTRMVNLRAS